MPVACNKAAKYSGIHHKGKKPAASKGCGFLALIQAFFPDLRQSGVYLDSTALR